MRNMNHQCSQQKLILLVKNEHMHLSIIFLFRILGFLVWSALQKRKKRDRELMCRFCNSTHMSFATQLLSSFIQQCLKFHVSLIRDDIKVNITLAEKIWTLSSFFYFSFHFFFSSFYTDCKLHEVRDEVGFSFALYSQHVSNSLVQWIDIGG